MTGVLRLRLAVGLGRLAGWVSRLVGRGGTAIPGLVAEAIDPRCIEKLIGTVPDGVVVVTGTNGKTTTTRMLVSALESSGVGVLTNPTGSNLARGLATVLIGASRRGRIDGHRLAVFEIDEAAVRALAPRLEPRLVVVTNLARDQLDRFGELDTTAGHVRVAVEHAGVAVLNADDPVVAGLDAGRSIWFGATDPIRAQVPHDRILYGAAGPDGPAFDVDALVESVVPEGEGQRVVIAVGGRRVEVGLRLPGVYNGYNAAAAVLAALELGVAPEVAVTALGEMAPAFGRGQVLEHDGRRVKILLVKNPAGFNQVVRLLHDAAAGQVLVAINDNHADGRDVSWLWDVGFEQLAGSGHVFGTSGIRAADMALRLKYAGVEAWAEPDLGLALERAIGAAEPGSTVHVVPTYTAMLAVLQVLRPGTSRAEAWS